MGKEAAASARGPSLKIAREKLKKKMLKDKAAAKLKAAEDKFRKSGGYGVKTVSCWDVPAGGIKNSPAYKFIVSRSGGKLPAPKDRAGAPVSGGFPLNKYPPNVLVDVIRAYWLPDEWAQVVKNTGPGGTYVGWMSPEGKFYYHRCGYPGAVEEKLGRRLSAKDGFNGILRSVKASMKANADKEFFQKCLSAKQRKHILPANKFHFAIVSARRATIDTGIQDIMTVEAHFTAVGLKPQWYVDKDSLKAYKDLGLNAKVGGKLTPARNMALNDAAKLGKRCVQVSDDIARWEFLDIAKQNFKGETTMDKANATLKGCPRFVISPLASAQFMLAKMRSDPKKPQLGGVFPTANAAMAMGTPEYAYHHFILGDFFVVDSSKCRFDNTMTLKEDYDFTCSHIKAHGSVLRCNRMFLAVKHATNGGGAVAVRDAAGSKEKYNIGILMKKWPGVFRDNPKRKNEVIMRWKTESEEDAETDGKKKKAKTAGSMSKAKGLVVKKIIKKKEVASGGSKKTAGQLKSKLHKLAKSALPFAASAIVHFTGKAEGSAYMIARAKKMDKKTVEQCLSQKVNNVSGSTKTYGLSDLRYDVNAGRLSVSKAKAKA